MKKLSSIFKGLVFMAFFTLSIGVKADVASVTLPHIFSGNNVFEYIDLNNDGTMDFAVSFDSHFYTSGSGFWDGRCIIGSEIPESPSGISISDENQVLSESILAASPSPMLSYAVPVHRFASILDPGDLIGDMPPFEGMDWRSYSDILFMLPHPPALNDNYFTGKKTGFLGVKFMADDGLHYAYIPVTIDDDGEPSVTLGFPGVNPIVGQAIEAGSGTAVPIPLIASLLGFGLIGGGIYYKRRKKK